MDILLSIRNPYTDLIFDGTKMLEFRNVIGKDVNIGDKIYIYETKSGNGSGSVIGNVEIEDIIKIPRYKIGTYFLLPYFVDKFGTKEEKETVKKATSFKLSKYDMSVVLGYLFDDEALDYMIRNDSVPDIFLNSKLKRYSKENTVSYLENRQKANDLVERCDEWATRIGFYNDFDESNWKYAIKLKNPEKYKDKVEISKFLDKNKKYIKRAPQSWCYTIGKI